MSNLIVIRNNPAPMEAEEEQPREPYLWEKAAPVIPRYKNLRISPFRLMQQRARDGLQRR
jgi:hypothetical protein